MTKKTTTVGPQTFDASQREIVVDIARLIYRMMGYDIRNKGIMYLYESQHPTEKAVLQTAEDIFEMFWGDIPDYDDEEE